MKLLIFNPYKNINERGLTSFINEYTSYFRNNNHTVDELSLPSFLKNFPNFLIFITFIIYQQFVIPVMIFKNRNAYVFDASNSYSFFGSYFSKYICVVHDLTIFRKLKFYKPSHIYLLLSYHLSIFVPVKICAINRIVAKQFSFLFKKESSGIFENLVINKNNRKPEKLPITKYLNSKKRNVFIISGPGYHKNFNAFYNYFQKSTKSFNFIIAGFGEEKVVIKGNSVFNFTSWLDKNDINALYKYSDKCIFYSLHEGFGRPIIEALQFRSNIFVNKRHPAIYRVKNYRKCIKFFSDFYELENLLCSFNKNSFEKPMIANYTPQELNELNF